MAEFDPDAYLAQGSTPQESAFDPDAYLAQSQPATPPESRKSRFARVAFQSAMKGAASLPDLALNIPNAVVNLPKAAVGSLANLAGRPDLAPDVNLQPNYAREALFKTGVATQEYEPQTPAERTLGAAVEGGTSALLSGKPSLAMFGLGATASGVGQGVTEATDNALLGTAANVLTTALAPSASKLGKSMVAKKQTALNEAKTLNASRDAIMKNALDNGLKVAPSEAQGRGLSATALNATAGKIATEGAISVENAKGIHNMVARDIGMPENTPLTPEVLSDARRAAHEAGYVPLRELGTIVPDEKYFKALDDLASAEKNAAKSFPKAATTDARKLASDLSVAEFDSSAAVDQIAELRAAADKAFMSGDKKLGGVNKKAAQALEDTLDSHLEKTGQGQLLDQYRKSRQLIAKTYTVENSINKATGIVDPQALARAIQSKSGGAISGLTRDAGEFAKAFPKSTIKLESAVGRNISKLDATLGGLSGGAALLHGGLSLANAPLAIAATVAPTLISAGARKAVLSNRYQKGQLPQYTANKNALSRIPEYTKSELARAALMSDKAMRNNEK